MQADKEYNYYLRLIKEANEHAYRYYTLSSPTISDSSYDELLREILKIEKQHPDWSVIDSPAKRVGGPLLTKFKSRPHSTPMLSLQNAFDFAEVQSFYQRLKKTLSQKPDGNAQIELSAELKYDGLAVALIYENGIFTRGATRGDGNKGEDVSENLRTVRNIPLALKTQVGFKPPALLEVRGEIFISHENFIKLNEERAEQDEAPFSNPRNAASGSLKLLDSSVTATRKLEAVIYQAAQWQQEKSSMEAKLSQVHSKLKTISKPETQGKLLKTLKTMGFPIPTEFTSGELEEINRFYNKWNQNRFSLSYDVDGIVIKVNKFQHREELGSTSKNPRWAIAWKFAAKRGITVLESVDFQVGKTGVLTPVANLRPITIGGVWVKRSTLHNIGEITRLGIKLGDFVEVKRAGDVIPKIDGVITQKRQQNKTFPIELPKKCPACYHLLFFSEDKIFLQCRNTECPGIQRERLRFFVSKSGLDMEGLGEKWVLKFLEAGLIRDGADLFALKVKDIENLDRMGQKLGENLINSIQQKKNASLSALIQSLGIPGIGEVTAVLLAKNFASLQNLTNSSINELEEIHEIGPAGSKSIVDFFNDKKIKDFLQRLFKNGFNVYPEKKAVILAPIEQKKIEQNPFYGKKVAVTGTLAMNSRKEAQQLIKSLGGKIASSVSAKTDYLVYGDSPGSKLDQANKYNVSLINEKKFLEIIDKAKH